MTTPVAATAPWQIDAAHTEIEFSVRHLMVSNVKGRFADPVGTVTYDPASPTSVQVDVTVPIATIDTRNAQRDAHLRSADFFDAEHFPDMVFRGTRIDGDVTGDFKLTGDLTIHSTTHEVTLDVHFEGRVDDPWGNDRVGFSATGKINRQDFQVKWNQAIEAGGVVVGDDVKLIINVELMRPKH
jgi:polyisoprenoid-binding protein YceI